jgi:hypothetical protein
MPKTAAHSKATSESAHHSAAADLVKKIALAIKNFTLYPEGHALLKGGMASLESALEVFLETHGDFHIDIEKDRILFKEETIFHGDSSDDNLVNILFRDGIQWLEFQEGITRSEIETLCRIIRNYRQQDEDAAEDLVTALWDADIPSIKYGTNDLIWQDSPATDVTAFQVSGQAPEAAASAPPAQDLPPSIASPDFDRSLWKLTPEEIEHTAAMVYKAEKAELERDMFDMLLIVLEEQHFDTDFATVLDFVSGLFQNALARGDYRFSYKIIKGMRNVYHTYVAERSWSQPLLDDFFIGLARPQTLKALAKVLARPTAGLKRGFEYLRKTLILMDPEVVVNLGPLLLKVPHASLRKQLMLIMATLAKRDMQPLLKLLKHPDHRVVQAVIAIIIRLRTPKTDSILLQLTQSDHVATRRLALNGLIKRQVPFTAKLEYLIEDEDPVMQRLMLRYMGADKSGAAERCLIDYLANHRSRREQQEHLAAVYTTLGNCGTAKAVPYLKERLWGRAWVPGPQQALHRRGAAAALLRIDCEEAQHLLNKASRSLIPTVRRAYQRARENDRQI